MNLNTANLKVGIAASTDQTRPNICSIHVTAQYTEATDGHLLARVSLPEQFNPDDMPVMIKTDHAENIKPFIIPAKSAMAIKPFYAKKRCTMPILNDTLYVDVAASNLNGTAKFTSTDLETTINPELAKIDADFPETERVLPTGKAEYQQSFNIDNLIRLLNIAKSIGGIEMITLYGMQSGHRTPLYMEAINEDTDQYFRGLVMPLKDR